MGTTTESVKLIVGAEDRASRTLGNIGAAAEGVEEKIGGLAKASADGGIDVQSLLAQFAGPELSEFGNQLWTVKDQVREFNAANAEGAQELTALKTGLVAAVAVGGFKFGQWLIGAKKLQQELNDEMKESGRLALQTLALQNKTVDFEQFQIGFIDGERKKVEALKKLLRERFNDENQNNQVDQAVEIQEGLVSKLANVWKNVVPAAYVLPDRYEDIVEYLKEFDGIRTASLNQIKTNEEIRKGLADQKEEIEEQIKRLEKAAQIKFGKKIASQFEDAKRKVIEFANQLAKAKKTEVKVETKELDKERGKKTLDNLKAQLIALRDGEKAAAAFRDQLAGMSPETSKQAQRMRNLIKAYKERNKLEAERLRESEKDKNKKTAQRGELTAREDRFSSGAGNPAADAAAKRLAIAQTANTILDQTKKAAESMLSVLLNIRDKPDPVEEVVS